MVIEERGIIFDAAAAEPSARACCFLSLAQTADGTLLAAFHTGSRKHAPDSNVRIMASDDGGRTWSCRHHRFPPELEGVPGSWLPGGLTEVEAGRLLGAFMWVDRSDPDRPFINPETTGVAPVRVLILESTDCGATWCRFSEVDFSAEPGAALTGPILRLSSGVLALPYERWKGYDDTTTNIHSACLRLSPDGGRSWEEVVRVNSHPEGRLFYWDQRLHQRLADGSLVGMFWTYDTAAERDAEVHIAWGSATGRTWSKPRPTGIQGQISAPLCLGGDRLLCAYVHRHPPASIRVRTSGDFGRSWPAASELTVYESAAAAQAGMADEHDFAQYWSDMLTWSFGHPAVLLLPEGGVLLGCYGGTAEAMSIHWVRLSAQ